MTMYALMSGNIVANIIMADDKESTEQALNCVLIEYTEENPASIGWTYDESTQTFIRPPDEDSTVESN